MAFVLDASVSAVWALAGESSAIADAAEDRLGAGTAIVPPLWWYEVRNLLIVSERRGKLTEADSAQYLKLLGSYPIHVDHAEEETGILQFARQYRLSFYDAAYLALAHRRSLALATLDKELREAAVRASIPLLA